MAQWAHEEYITYCEPYIPFVFPTADQEAIVLAVAGFVGQGAIGVLGWWFWFLSIRPLWGLLFMPLIWALRIFLAYEIAMGIKNVLANEKKLLPWIGRFVSGV